MKLENKMVSNDLFLYRYLSTFFVEISDKKSVLVDFLKHN